MSDPAAVVMAPARGRSRGRGGSRREFPGGFRLVIGVAVVLVCYAEIAAWFREHDQHFAAGGVIELLIATPLLVEKDLGFAGAALLLLVAGFAIADATCGDGTARFVVRNSLRVIPLALIATVLTWAAYGSSRRWAHAELLFAAVIMLLFAWLTFRMFRREPWIAVAVQITLCSVATAVIPHVAGAAASPFGASATFGLAVVLGQTCWLVHAGHVPLWAGALLGVACWMTFVWGDRTGFGHDAGDANPLTLAYATVLMAAAVQVRAEIATGRIMSWLTSRSYPLLLTGPGVGVLVLSWLPAAVPADIRAVMAICVAGLLSDALYRAWDLPAQRLAGWVMDVLVDRVDHVPGVEDTTRLR
ncbi:MAG: hypothetical protein GEU86_11465 [Actinophytocola sp.]|nr:hypothetical protein [Actinophytocola sp.]